jgi:hypothetical protein
MFISEFIITLSHWIIITDPTSSLSGVKMKAKDGRGGSVVKKKEDEKGGSRTGVRVKAEDESSGE